MKVRASAPQARGQLSRLRRAGRASRGPLNADVRRHLARGVLTALSICPKGWNGVSRSGSLVPDSATADATWPGDRSWRLRTFTDMKSVQGRRPGLRLQALRHLSSEDRLYCGFEELEADSVAWQNIPFIWTDSTLVLRWRQASGGSQLNRFCGCQRHPEALRLSKFWVALAKSGWPCSTAMISTQAKCHCRLRWVSYAQRQPRA